MPPVSSRRRGLLARLGLREAPSDPGQWVRVASAPIDDATTGHSQEAARVAESLRAVGIETRRQPYVLPDTTGFRSSGPDAVDRIRVAVLVRAADLERAKTHLTTGQ